MKNYFVILCLLLVSSPALLAAPDVDTVFDRTLEQHLRARVINNTNKDLACYLAIDGYKIRFYLPPFQRSLWYKATDARFNYKDFKTWCDYLENHPEYRKYKFKY